VKRNTLAGEEAGDRLGDSGQRGLDAYGERADDEEKNVRRLHAHNMGSHLRIGTK
jgi:hypothetical protein